MPLLQQDLRCHVVGRANHAKSAIIVALVILAVTKVGEANVTFVVEEDVFGLEVPVDDVHLVKILERQDDFCCIESSPWLRKVLLSCYVREKLPSVDKVHDETQPVCSLEGIVQLNDERMVYHLKNSPFSFGGLNKPSLVNGLVDVDDASKVLSVLQLLLKLCSGLLFLLQCVFPDDLHRINLASIDLFYLQNFSVCSFPHNVEKFKI
mmetsp:Transcript_10300/g.23534  ORF Transcript_10300/g.23534 Transcript_10300/m.23534 type:complete len:208 (-) Transcript_10300:615-1238(-)